MDGKAITISNHTITPACQEAHGGLLGAMLEAATRAGKAMEEVARFPCNEGATFNVVVTMERRVT